MIEIFFLLRHITQRHRCQLPIIRFVPKQPDQTWLISLRPGTDKPDAHGERWPSHDFMWLFALKNNSMEFLPGPITRRMNVMYESQMKWTWHHSKLAVEEVSFFSRLRMVLLQLLIYTRWSSRRYRLGCHTPLSQRRAVQFSFLLAKIYILASMFVCRFVTCQNFEEICKYVRLSVCLSVSLSVLSSITHECFDISSPNLVHIWNGWAVPVCNIGK